MLFRQKKYQLFFLSILLLAAFFVADIKEIWAAFDPAVTYSKTSNGQLSADEWNNLQNDFVRTWGNTTAVGGIGIGVAPQSTDFNGLVASSTIKTNMAFLGVLNANYISKGTFGAFTGGGDYIFPAAVGIGVAPSSAGLQLENTGAYSAIIRMVNTGASGGNYFIGSTNSGWDVGGNKLIFGVGTPSSANVKMLMDASGNVGIGTTAPVEKLHVVGNISVNSGGSFRLYNAAGTGWAEMAYNQVDNLISFQRGLTASGNDFKLAMGGQNSYLNANSGKVGIGTTNPTAPLTIQQTNDSSGFKLIGNSDPTTIFSFYIGAGGSNNPRFTSTKSMVFEASNGVYFRGPSGVFINDSNSANILLASGGGNVGIGTTTPNAKLSVSGGNIFINDAAITSATPNAAITKSYLDSSLSSTTASIVTQIATSSLWQGSLTGAVYNNNSGNVGIGTTAPTAKTEIVGSASNPSLTHNATSILNLNRGESGATEVAFTIMGAAPYTASIQHRHSLSDGSSYPLALNPLGGNVGIGTTNPITPLNVIGKWQYNNAGAIYSQDNSYSLDLAGINVDSLKVYKDLYSTAGVLKTDGTGNNWMMGNLGVGLTNPAYKLDVLGNTRLDGSQLSWYKETKNQVAYMQGVQANARHEVRIPWPTGKSGSIILDVDVLIDTGAVATQHYIKKRFYLTSYYANNQGDLYSQRSYVVDSLSGSSITYNYVGDFEEDTTNGQIVLPIYSGSGNNRNNSVILTAWGTDSVVNNINNATFTANVQTGVVVPDRQTVQAPPDDNYSFAKNVGIGTTNPGAKLDVVGAFRTTSATISLLGNSGDRIVMTDNSGNLYATSTSVATGLPSPSGISGYTLRSNGASWIANNLLYNNGTNVGIGTTAPSAKLDVNGDVKGNNFIGNLYNFDVRTNNPLPQDVNNSFTSWFSTQGTNYAPSGVGHASGFTVAGYYGLRNRWQMAGDATATPNDFNKWYLRTGSGSTWGVWRQVITDDGAGNVGIGTAAPQYKLDVAGEANFGGSQIHGVAAPVQGTDAVNRNYVDSNFIASTSLATITNAFVKGGNSFGSKATLGSIDNQDFGIITNNSERVTVLKDGNMGVGTTDPTSLLHLNGTDANIRVQNSGYNTGQSSITFGHGGSGNEKTGIVALSNGTWGKSDLYFVLDSDNDSGPFGVATDSKMMIKNSGNVGIGTTAPNEQLEITKNFRLPATVGTTPYGIIYKDGTRFIHDFNYGLNGNGITTAGRNTFVGLNAGNFTMGSTATAAGQASYNTGIGYLSLYSNTTGSQNTANGTRSLLSNTTGNDNTANGYYSLSSNTTGNSNTANGVYSLSSNTTGSYNTANGYQSLFSNITGSNNTAIGFYSGRYLANGTTGRSTGNYGLYLGYNSKASADGTNNEIVIGYNAIGKGSSTATYGNSSMLKHIFEAGNVGIGTTGPGYKLDVAGDLNLNTYQIHNLGAPVTGTDAVNRNYVDTLISDSVSATDFWKLNGSNLYSSSTAWNVGIGTTSPAAKLDVVGAAFFGITNKLKIQESSDFLSIQGTSAISDSAKKSIILNAWGGNVGIGITSPREKLDISSALRVGEDGKLTIYPTAGGSCPGCGTEAMSLQTTIDGRTVSDGLPYDSASRHVLALQPVFGYVGIGTTTPTHKLHVAGDASFMVGTSSPSQIHGVAAPTQGTDAVNRNYVDSNFIASTSLPTITFVQGGNSFGAKAILGTNDNQALGLETNGTEKMTILANGNVGIGTTNPVSQLQLEKTVSALTDVGLASNYSLFLRYPLSSSGAGSGIAFGTSASTDNVGSAIIHERTGGEDKGKLNFYTKITTTLGAAPALVMTLSDNGNVGIGTANPGQKLDVNGRIRFQDYFEAYYGGSTLSGRFGSSYWLTTPGGQTDTSLTAVNNIYFAPGSTTTPSIIFKAGGNVGVGTTTPVYKLDLAGDLNLNTYQIHNLGAPATGTDAVNRNYVDTLINDSVSATDFWKLNGSNLYTSSTAWNVGIGTATPNQQLEITKNFRLPATVGTNAYGVIYKDGNRFIHDFNYGDNGTVTTAGYNTFLGVNAGNFTMGSTASATHHSSYNTGIGMQALANNTTGYQNSAIGMRALYSNTTGSNNSAIGVSAFQNNTTGSNNSAIGYFSLFSNTTGHSNSAIGVYAGRYLSDGTTGRETGSNGLYLGYNSKASANGTNNEIVIGADAIGKGSNTAAYGNSSMFKHIFEAGNVGIGTTTPTHKLHVAGDASFMVGTSSPSQIHGVAAPTQGTDAVNRNYVDSNFIASTSLATITNAFVQGGNSFGVKAILGTNDNQALGIETNGTEKMTILANGNVGIGVASPTYKLDVVANNNRIRTVGTTGYTLLDLQNTGGSLYLGKDSSVGGQLVAGSAAYSGVINSQGSYPLHIATNGTIAMTILNGGNVGIGTTTPNAALDIFGKAKITNNGIIYNTDSSRWLDMTGANADSLRVSGNLITTNGNILASQVYAKLSLGIQGASGDVHFGSSGNGSPVNGLQDYGFYAAHNAYRASDGNWYHSRTDSIPAVRFTGGGGVASGTSGFRWDYSANSGSGAITWSNLMQLTTAGNLGIGTTNPGIYKLNVNGSILAQGTDDNTAPVVNTVKLDGYGLIGNRGNLYITNSSASGVIQFGVGGVHNVFPKMVILSSGNVGIGTTTPSTKLYVNGVVTATGGFSGPLTGTVNAANISKGIFGTNTGQGTYSFGGVTANGDSHYQWEGATYRNPGDYTPQINIRQDNATTGINGFKPALTLYNQNGDLNSTIGLDFSVRETTAAGNATALAGIMAIKESAGTSGAWTQGGLLFYTKNMGTRVDALRILNNGNVGIGVDPGNFKLKVAGNVAITGTLQTMTGSDFAEEFTVSSPLEAGTVVVMGDLGYKSVKACGEKFDNTVVGVVSDNPSIIAGRVDSKHKAVVAMAGVVKVKVSATNGKIKKGSMLTTSNISGYAMKADSAHPGTIIGKALENLSGQQGEVKVLINLQ